MGHWLVGATHSTAPPLWELSAATGCFPSFLCIRHWLIFSRPSGHVTGSADTKINKDRGQEGTLLSQELLDLDQYSKQAFPWNRSSLWLSSSNSHAEVPCLLPPGCRHHHLSQVKFLLPGKFGWSQGRSLFAKSKLLKVMKKIPEWQLPLLVPIQAGLKLVRNQPHNVGFQETWGSQKDCYCLKVQCWFFLIGLVSGGNKMLIQ